MSQLAAGARRSGTVLIVGESGTGRNRSARALHECGSRSCAVRGEPRRRAEGIRLRARFGSRLLQEQLPNILGLSVPPKAARCSHEYDTSPETQATFCARSRASGAPGSVDASRQTRPIALGRDPELAGAQRPYPAEGSTYRSANRQVPPMPSGRKTRRLLLRCSTRTRCCGWRGWSGWKTMPWRRCAATHNCNVRGSLHGGLGERVHFRALADNPPRRLAPAIAHGAPAGGGAATGRAFRLPDLCQAERDLIANALQAIAAISFAPRKCSKSRARSSTPRLPNTASHRPARPSRGPLPPAGRKGDSHETRPGSRASRAYPGGAEPS